MPADTGGASSSGLKRAADLPVTDLDQEEDEAPMEEEQLIQELQFEGDQHVDQDETPVEIANCETNWEKLMVRNGITTDIIDGQLIMNLTSAEDYYSEALAGIEEGSVLDAAIRNSRPEEVGVIQDLLVAEGLMVDPEGARGWYGPMTTSAITAFQESWGLEPTGAVDAATRDALVEHAAGGEPPAEAGSQIPDLKLPE